MNIKDLVVNSSVTITLVVTSAVAKKTKSEKPYLAMEFFDGTTSIKGNYWDWTSGNIPAVNTILDVTAAVTEWQGEKQLNIKSLRTNTTRDICEFAPKSEHDIDAVYASAVELMSDVSDDTLRTLALAILKELEVKWKTVPGAKSVHHNYVGGTLVHCHDVAIKAKAIAKTISYANVDLAVVGGMLHDLGKLFTYTLDGATIDKSTDGMLYEHLFMGAEFIGNFAEAHVDVEDPYVYNKVRLLRHIILSHHGSLEHGSPVVPQSVEAHIVNHADSIDAICEQIRIASNAASTDSMFTDKIWTVGNSKHLTTQYVSDIMLGYVG